MPVTKTLTVGGNTYDFAYKTSDLTNDSGFVDAAGAAAAAPVQSVNGQTGDVVTPTEQDIADAIIQVLPVDSASGAVASFPDGYPAPVEALSVQITPVQSGSGTPAPDNVRPITGWSEAVVTRSGVNVWDEEWESGSYNDNGTKVVNNSRIRCKNPIHVAPSTTYYVNASTSNYELYVLRYTASGSFIAKNLVRNTTFNTTADTGYILFFVAGLTTYNHDISINYPSTDHSYHAYSGQTVTIDLSGTRYGGTLDVLTGVLTVTHGIVDIGSLGWNRTTSYTHPFFYAAISDRAKGLSIGSDFMSSVFKKNTTNYFSPDFGANAADGEFSMAGDANSVQCFVRCDAYTTAQAFTTGMTGQKIVFLLATTTTVQLTPAQLETILGQNNIWANCGDVAVSYRADIQRYIEKKLS